jgi:hypothetical protein
MNEVFEDKKKLVIAIIIFLLFIMIIAAIIVNFKNYSKNVGIAESTALNDTINYVTTLDGNKTNMSDQLAADKKVGDILLEKNTIVYRNGISKLTSKVVNDNIAKDNLRFKVKFIANDGTVIAESVGFAGSIKENETKYIESNITADVVNAKDIVYEIIE